MPPSATPEQKWQHQQLLNFNAIQSSIQAQTTSLLNQQRALLNVQQQVTNLVNNNSNNPPNRHSNQQTRQQEREKAFHKQLQSFKIKLACKFQCEQRLNHKPAQTVQEQFAALLWYHDAILFADQSEIGEYDSQYLIELIAENIITRCGWSFHI